ncbi:histidine kinase [Flavobacterium columnare]|uniref:Signal transduction histidine kinase LytS n=2 Tax=Flavobacterium columnare TaxID=996 RepID=G8X588_FLACA|nr:histidine kinase [Flavobacterium columnare]AEW85499.1 signal transduction histidine kinase LytS [Flavobacterium columnare ATCC 49512]AMO20101.1 histidine kinase [Flavobacterium columnare]ANO49301.1 signal transduction histidine kinase LytS [Flavobacterium columnare]APT22717.1 histidine kinase [Flavobacterium columnare]AUX18051.1 histidine kinase [Flavobacterium columnare]
MKLITNWKYHILNFIGWQIYLLSILTFEKLSYGLFQVEKWSDLEWNKLYYFIAEGVLCGFLGFLLSNVILVYVDYKVQIGKISKRALWGIVLVFVLSQILYHLLLWPFLSVPLKYFLDRENPLTFLMKLANIPVFGVSFLVWFFVVMTYKIFKYLKEIKIKQLELETNLREITLNTLKGQINPHFMFNSLNNIRGLILENPSKSREMLTRLSEMLRYSLTKSDTNKIVLEEELEMVSNYIALSKIQLEDRLEYITEINSDTLYFSIPPMIVQMLVENAVKHGVSNIKEGGVVKLISKIKKNELHLIVENTGFLKKRSTSTQIGLKNIRERLFLLYANRATFEIVEENKMVKAKVVIPFNV